MPRYRAQHGAATLVISLVLLFSMTLIVLYSARSVITEQRIIANDYRAKQAFEAAQAGLEAGLTRLAPDTLSTAGYDAHGWAEADGGGAVLGNASRYHVRYDNRELKAYDPSLVRITSAGLSEDASSTHIISQVAQFTAMISNMPPAPLVSRGRVLVGKYVTVINADTDIAIWSGGGARLEDPSGFAVGDTPPCPGGICDAVQTLAEMDGEEFFENFFGQSGAVTGSLSEKIRCERCATQLDGREGVALWIEGHDKESVFNGDYAIGAPGAPVIIIVNGDLTLRGRGKLFGILYVNGALKMEHGNWSLKGAVITAGDIILSAAGDIRYDPSVLGATLKLGSYAKVPGTWKDF